MCTVQNSTGQTHVCFTQKNGAVCKGVRINYRKFRQKCQWRSRLRDKTTSDKSFFELTKCRFQRAKLERTAAIVDYPEYLRELV